MKYTVISVDDHLVEPPHMFEGRLPAQLQDRAPKVVVNDDGHEVWELEGNRHYQPGMNAVAGRRPNSYGLEPFRFDQMRPGCTTRTCWADMDLGGIWPGQLPVDDHRLLRTCTPAPRIRSSGWR